MQKDLKNLRINIIHLTLLVIAIDRRWNSKAFDLVLDRKLNYLVENEEYEMATILQEIIKKRKHGKEKSRI